MECSPTATECCSCDVLARDFHDCELTLPAGHLDGGEDAVGGLLRELNEELTITAERDSCRLAVVVHRAAETPGEPGDGRRVARAR